MRCREGYPKKPLCQNSTRATPQEPRHKSYGMTRASEGKQFDQFFLWLINLTTFFRGEGGFKQSELQYSTVLWPVVDSIHKMAKTPIRDKSIPHYSKIDHLLIYWE